MKNLTNSFAIVTTGITLVLGLGNAPANALSFNFTQSGWIENPGPEVRGEVIGMFTGTDINGDGFISFSNSEVTAYMMSFTGNSTIPAFTNNLAGLQTLTYMLGSDTFNDISSSNGTFSYDGTFGLILPPPGRAISTSQTTIVTPKPVPETTPLTALLILGISGCIHRQVSSRTNLKLTVRLGNRQQATGNRKGF